jgi:hypothetical protein
LTLLANKLKTTMEFVEEGKKEKVSYEEMEKRRLEIKEEKERTIQHIRDSYTINYPKMKVLSGLTKIKEISKKSQ